MLRLKLTPRSEALRKDLQQWLAANPPPATTNRQSLATFVEISTAWQQRLANDAWVAVHWPEQYGGRGLTLLEEAVVQECLAEARAPQLINLFGLTMVGPVLIEHGTDAQRTRFLRAILRADEIWCQGFSEPEAGSDLAALTTSAVIDGESYSITGQKVWTSFAQYADWCFLLARTSVTGKKHEGLSYLLLPMDVEGLEIRPLTQISGDSEFNELFFNGARTSVDNIVGAPGDGWKIAIRTLMYERVILTFARHLQSEVALSEIRDVLRASSTESQRERFGRLAAKSMAVRAMAINHLRQYDTKVPGPEGSLDKLAWSETFQEICSWAFELSGIAGCIESGMHSVDGGAAVHRYLYSRGRTIAAGTSEIQKNIIAERILNLPRS